MNFIKTYRSHRHSTKTHSFVKRIISDNCNFMVESASYIFASRRLSDIYQLMQHKSNFKFKYQSRRMLKQQFAF